MFKVGKIYEISLYEPDPDPEKGGIVTHYPNWEVVQVDMPLVKMRRSNEEKIFNTASHIFVSATLQP